jgi:hypothetical protein
LIADVTGTVEVVLLDVLSALIVLEIATVGAGEPPV